MKRPLDYPVENILQFSKMHPEVEGPTIDNNTLLIRAFGVSSDGNRRHNLLPAKTARWMETRLSFVFPEKLLFISMTPSNLIEMKIATLSFRFDQEHLLIHLCSFNHDNSYIPHGAPIALLNFVAMVPVVLEERQ